jgi:hypothetical protein
MAQGPGMVQRLLLLQVTATMFAVESCKGWAGAVPVTACMRHLHRCAGTPAGNCCDRWRMPAAPVHGVRVTLQGEALTLSATTNLDFFSRARYTLPNLPRPSGLPMSKSDRDHCLPVGLGPAAADVVPSAAVEPVVRVGCVGGLLLAGLEGPAAAAAAAAVFCALVAFCSGRTGRVSALPSIVLSNVLLTPALSAAGLLLGSWFSYKPH